MPVAVVFLLRAAVLILLWGFVIAAVVAVRHDVFSERTPPTTLAPAATPAAPQPPPTPAPAPAAKPSRAARRAGRRKGSAPPTRVVVVDGPAIGASVILSSLPITIGRAEDSTIVLVDDYVSNHHSRLIPRGKDWLVEDTGSTNGTFIGDTKVTSPVVVPAGTRIRIGRNTLELPVSPRLRVGGRSDVGLHRHNNQDSMYAGPRLIAVADGVGGAAGGEVASAVTITALMSLDTDPITDPAAALQAAAEAADASIRSTVARDAALGGMSTTLTAILATDVSVTLAHIGDSRAYLLRGGELSQLTHDHTLVQTLIDEGEISEQEALTHPRRSWIMRALDGRGQPELDFITLDPQPGDRYLLCSDGLSSYVSAGDIATGLAGDDPQIAADRLTDLALKAGGADNITCIVADPVDGELVHQPPILAGAVADLPAPNMTLDTEAEKPQQPPRAELSVARPRSIGRRLAAVAAVVVLLVAAGVAGVAVYIHHQWYVAPAGGQVAVYQGVQGNAAGIHLSHLHVRTNLPVSALPQDDRDRVTSGIQASGGKTGAGQVVTNLRQEACALVTPTADASPTPTATSTHKLSAAVKPTPSPPVWCASTP